jgi:hypothetical protein
MKLIIYSKPHKIIDFDLLVIRVLNEIKGENFMEMNVFQVIGKLHKTTKLIGNDCIFTYHNSNEQKHREDGPAIIAELKEQNNEYLEWWNNGQLTALFNKSKDAFLKSSDGTYEQLYKIEIPEKWKGCERTIALCDIENFN